ncbi:signal transduction histidine kinase [Streptosporangium album]|uniref:histidine kinase n=1 Tax=Streptosporangium album TaxID=47479 RepID=A0A7W7RXM9_9ACTN|nr:HAMP domain-containing sensor histidine kinase [Streptosporangium album]MBB4940090.1 signal transduction histidine kinase [Streptosporangium album]
MRRRLLTIYMSLLALSLVTLTVPFAANVAARDTQTAFIEQQGDTLRFASLAEPALRSGQSGRLRAELARYHGLFGIGAAVVDRDGRPLSVSPPTLSLAGARTRKLIERGLSADRPELETIWPWRAEELVIVEPVIREGEVVGAAVTAGPTDRLRGRIAGIWAMITLGCLIALGLTWFAARRLARWTLRPVHELDAVTHDITEGRLEARVAHATGPPELRRLAVSFNVMADTMTEMLERQRTFVSQASHQLRTPLGALRLRVENLADHLRASGRHEHELTLEETERLARTLEGLLALARAERHQNETGGADLVAVDAADTADRRLDAWRPRAAELGVTLRRTGGLGGCVLTVPEALDQLLDALIDNALKFGADEVTVHVEQADDLAEIHVLDNGPGLPEEARTRALGRFWRSPAHQNVDGSGLGLSIVAVLVAASGGSVDLLAREPSGLDVRVRLRLESQKRVPR